MAEIKRIYRQSLPAMKFVGRCYGEADKQNGTFSHKWGEWFDGNLFEPLCIGNGGKEPFEDCNSIAKKHFVMCVRSSMQDYLKKLSDIASLEGSILFYSMWDGYKKKQDVSDFLNFMQQKGVRIIPLHTSGHADAGTIDALVNDTKPSVIIPVHTENAAWFKRYTDATVVDTGNYELQYPI